MEHTTLVGRIVDGLSRGSSRACAGAEVRARAAFLHWAVSLPDNADIRRAARAALAVIDRLGRSAVEVDLFRSYLEAAARPLPEPARGGAGRRRRPRPSSGEAFH